MNKAESIIKQMNEVIPGCMKLAHMTHEQSVQGFLELYTLSFLKNENNIDVLDFALAHVLLGRKWDPSLTIKIFHDIYYSDAFKAVEADVDNIRDGVMPDVELPLGLARRYMDLFYKPGHEDTDAFLWRCLCLGCMPSAKFLRMSEKKKHEVFTREMEWAIFEDILDLSEEDIDTAVNLSGLTVDGEEVNLTGEKEN